MPKTAPKMLKEVQHDSSLCLKLQQQRMNENFIDCFLHVKTEDYMTKTFKCHRVILASGSQYFNDCFKSKTTVTFSRTVKSKNNLLFFLIPVNYVSD